MFGSSLSSKFYRQQDSLPDEMRYFDGHPGETLTSGTPWLTGKFVTVDSTFEIAPGMHLISLVSETVGTSELRELSMAIETPQGMIVVAGCSHPAGSCTHRRCAARHIQGRPHSARPLYR